MAEQIQKTFIQRCMEDFATGAPWVPTAAGPTGYARPQGHEWRDSPTLKLALDVADRLCPDTATRGALRAWAGEPELQAQAVVDATVLPALEAVARELDEQGYPVALEHDTGAVTLRVTNYNGSHLVYDVSGEVVSEPVASLAQAYQNQQQRHPVVRITSWGRTRLRKPTACSQKAMARDCRHEMRRALLW